MKKRLTVSASPGLLEFRSLKMPNSKRWLFSDDMSCPTSTNKSFCQENLNGVDSFSFGLFSIHHNHLSISQMTTAMTNMMSHHWWHQWQRWWGQRQPQRHSFPVDTFQSVSSESIMASTPRTLFQKEYKLEIQVGIQSFEISIVRNLKLKGLYILWFQDPKQVIQA